MKKQRTVKIRSKRFKNAQESQIFKRKTRARKEWAQLRQDVRDLQYDMDPISLKPLSHSAALHHMGTYSVDFYDDFDLNRFRMLNSKTHDTVHFLFDIVLREGDFGVFDRLHDFIQNMLDIYNSDKERFDD